MFADKHPAGDRDHADKKASGDGLHHHAIDEDEGGGYHSKHTHPDGRVEHEDHTDYDEAKASMDEKFGHGEPDGGDDMEDGMDDDDDGGGDAASSYNRAACD